MLDMQVFGMVFAAIFAATILQTGPVRFRAGLKAIVRSLGQSSSWEAELSLRQQIARIRRDGPYRHEPEPTGCVPFDDLLRMIAHKRSLDAVSDWSIRAESSMTRHRKNAMQLLANAQEAAPGIGLAGTLLSLSMIAGDTGGAQSILGAAAAAVATTLYALVIAQFLLAPLAGLVERKFDTQLEQFQRLAAWLQDESGPVSGRARLAAAA